MPSKIEEAEGLVAIGVSEAASRRAVIKVPMDEVLNRVDRVLVLDGLDP
jgi:hypothetical protein